MWTHFKTQFNSLFPKRGDKLLFFAVILCGLIILFSSLNKVEAAEDSLYDFTFTLDNSYQDTDIVEDVLSNVYHFLGINDSSYTVSDFRRDIGLTIADLYFGVAPGTADDLLSALGTLIRDTAFTVDSSTGFFHAVNQNSFRRSLQDIYERLGYEESSVNIGYWRPLPFEYGNVRLYSDTLNMYGTHVLGSGGSRFIVAIRSSDSSSTVMRMYIASQYSSSVASVNTFYQGTNHSGYWKQVSDASAAVAVSNLWDENNYPYYYDNDINVAVQGALADFFGLDNPGGLLWNGDIYFDNRDHSALLNTVPNSSITPSTDRWNYLHQLDRTDETDNSFAFDTDTTIVLDPDTSVPIWFVIDPDPEAWETVEFPEPGEFSFPKTMVDADGVFYDTWLNSQPVYVYQLFMCVFGIGAAAFILRRK